MNLLLTSDNANPPQKYIDNRDVFQTGDLVLYRGTSILSKGIQYFDNAYYNHIGVVIRLEEFDRNLTLDMWAQGLAFSPLSRRISGYKDFCILRPKVSEQKATEAIRSIMQSWDGRDIEYDKLLLLRVAIIKKTGIDFTGLGDKSKFICSELAQYYCHLLNLTVYDEHNLITPQDFLRYVDENFIVLLNDAPTK